MKLRFHFLFVVVWAIVYMIQAAAQGAQFYRISGPAPVAIIAFRPDGSIVWSNALPGTNYTVQTIGDLSDAADWVDYVQIPVTNGINTNQLIAINPPTGLRFIPAGIFTMGNTLDDEPEAIPINVIVSGFYMDTDMVSYSQWQAIYSWATNNGYGFDGTGGGKALNHPVVYVDWYDAVKWCNARSQHDGLCPVYYTDIGLTQIYTNGAVDICEADVNWSANGYRLPTEAEWEKAARGGRIDLRFPWGNTISENQANYDGDTNDYSSYDFGPNGFNAAFDSGGTPYTSPLGYFAPNGYGLYDMAGNADQWCWDWYGVPYSGGVDPHGPASSPYDFRVLRGGDWVDFPLWLRCAGRAALPPWDGGFASSFRCVRRF